MLAIPNRSRRVLLLLLTTWVLNYCDLGWTLIEAERHLFQELNPVAATLVHLPSGVLVVYKVGLVGIGSLILYLLRRNRLAELAAWFTASQYGGVAIRWSIYYEHVFSSLDDPAVNFCPLTGMTFP